MKNHNSIKQSIYCFLKIVSIFLFYIQVSSAQTVDIPDPAFRQYLLDSLPQVMDGQQKLIITKAATVIGINIVNRPVKDLTGIEYFTNLYNMQFRFNQLTTLPNLNFITGNHDVSVQIEGNPTTILPLMPNRLSSLGLYALPSLHSITGITNPGNLVVLSASNTAIERINVGNYPNLDVFSSYYNNIPPVITFGFNPKLEGVVIHGNGFTSLPDMSSLTFLYSLSIQQNKLTFSDLIVPKQVYDASTNPAPGKNINITPQDSIGSKIPVNFTDGNTYTIDLNIDDALTGNVYKWYRNGSLVTTTSGNMLTVTLGGVYTCDVNNAQFPALTLHSYKMILAQNIYIPDANFRNYLVQTYPQVMDANQLLIPSEAAKISQIYTGPRGIADITGIEYFTSLTLLNVAGNKLTTVPGLSSSIGALVLEDNKLTSLNINNLNPNLYWLRIGGNPSLAPFDLSVFTKLAHFSCRDNGWSTLPDMSMLPKFESIEYYNNKISTLPAFAPNVTIVNYFCESNQLTFEDLFQINYPKLYANSLPGQYFIYTPQDSTGVSQRATVTGGNTYMISLNVDNAVTSNVYNWYRGGKLVSITSVNMLSITGFDALSQGVYTCKITNPNYPALTLNSRKVSLLLQGAQNIDIPDPNFKKCLMDSVPYVFDADNKLIAQRAPEVQQIACPNRNIINLEGVQYFTKLNLLNVNYNQLTSIPGLDGITSYLNGNVFDFLASNNHLTALPALPQNIAALMVSNNSITSMQNIIHPENLEVVNISSNPIAVPDLSNSPNLRIFMANGNTWGTLPGFNNNTKLITIQVVGNNLSSLPDLSTLDSLRMLWTSGNALTFEDLLAVRNQNPYVFNTGTSTGGGSLRYSFQDSVGTAQTIQFIPGSTYVIDLDIDDTVTSNIYKWYRNGTLISVTAQNRYTASISGIYTCDITNTKLADLSLHSRMVNLQGDPSPWITITAGLNNQIIIVPSFLISNINGSALAPGDYLGVFFETSIPGQYACGAQTIWTNNSLVLSVYKNTDSTGKNGFTEGEPFMLKVWKSVEQKEYTVTGIYTVTSGLSSGFYKDGAASMIISLNSLLTSCTSQAINLYKGWNLISLNVAPEDTSMSNVLAGITPIIVKNAAGNILYAPQNSITSGKWSLNQGYQVYVTQSNVLSVCGVKINANKPISIPLNSYPYFMPYYPANQRPIVGTLASIENSFQYVQCTEYNAMADALIASNYVPAHIISPAIDQIGNMKPGLAYKVMATAAIPSFQYANTAGLRESTANARESAMSIPVHFGVATGSTGNNSVLVLSKDLFDPALAEGDEIGVFAPDGALAGSIVYNGNHLAITVFENASMKAGDKFTFKVWRSTTDKEANLDITFTTGSGNFLENSLQVASVARVMQINDNESISQISSYPNPASEMLTIRIMTNAETEAAISIRNILGETLETLPANALARGSNEIRYNTSKLSNGAYVYTVKLNNEEIRGKFVVAK